MSYKDALAKGALLLFWELKPNFTGHFKLTTFTSNSRGLRANREYAFDNQASPKPCAHQQVSLTQDKERYRVAARQLEKHALTLVDAGSEFGPSLDLKYTTTRLDRQPNPAAHRKFAEALMKSIPWELQAGE